MRCMYTGARRGGEGNQPGGGGLGGSSALSSRRGLAGCRGNRLDCRACGSGASSAAGSKAWAGRWQSGGYGPTGRTRKERKAGLPRTGPGASNLVSVGPRWRMMLWGPCPFSGATGCCPRPLSCRTWDSCFQSKYELVRMARQAFPSAEGQGPRMSPVRRW